MLLFSFSVSFLLFRNTINICVLILHPAAWFNLPSVFCFVDCHSQASYVDVHRTDNKMASTGNEECRDLYGTVFGSVPNLIKAKPLEKGRVATTTGIFTAVQGDSESAFAEKSGFEDTVDRHFQRPPSPKGMGQDDLSCQAKEVKSPHPSGANR